MDNTSTAQLAQQYDDDPTGLEAALRCRVCGIEATEGDRGRRVGDDEWLCTAHQNIPITEPETSYADDA